MMRVYRPKDAVTLWRVDMTLSCRLLPAFVTFCYNSFGAPDGLDPRRPARWQMRFRDRLRPPWLELTFRERADVAMLHMFDVNM